MKRLIEGRLMILKDEFAVLTKQKKQNEENAAYGGLLYASPTEGWYETKIKIELLEELLEEDK
jgi:hypothetical protein